jgi:hypothetical protein
MYYHPSITHPAVHNALPGKERNTVRTLKTSAYYINLGAAAMLIGGLPQAQSARFVTAALVTDMLIDQGHADSSQAAFRLMSPAADDVTGDAFAEMLDVVESLLPILEILGKATPEDASRDAAMNERGNDAVAKIVERIGSTQGQEQGAGTQASPEPRRRCGQQDVLPA